MNSSVFYTQTLMLKRETVGENWYAEDVLLVKGVICEIQVSSYFISIFTTRFSLLSCFCTTRPRDCLPNRHCGTVTRSSFYLLLMESMSHIFKLPGTIQQQAVKGFYCSGHSQKIAKDVTKSTEFHVFAVSHTEKLCPMSIHEKLLHIRLSFLCH